jgi:hypothetical protein
MSNFMKIHPVEAELFHENGQTDGHDEADNLLLQSALHPLVGFGLLYHFVPQSSNFTLLSLQFLTSIFFISSSTWSSHLSLGLPTGFDKHGSLLPF